MRNCLSTKIGVHGSFRFGRWDSLFPLESLFTLCEVTCTTTPRPTAATAMMKRSRRVCVAAMPKRTARKVSANEKLTGRRRPLCRSVAGHLESAGNRKLAAVAPFSSTLTDLERIRRKQPLAETRRALGEISVHGFFFTVRWISVALGRSQCACLTTIRRAATVMKRGRDNDGTHS